MRKFIGGSRSMMIALLGVLTNMGYEGICLETEMAPDGTTAVGMMLTTSLVNERLRVLEGIAKGFEAAWTFKENETRSMSAGTDRRW